jgi:hypothetical protein
MPGRSADGKSIQAHGFGRNVFVHAIAHLASASFYPGWRSSVE